QLYLTMNLAVPPLDDIHVRRAINFVVDKQRVLTAFERDRQQAATVARHMAPDSLEKNLLLDYDPYGPGQSGDLQRAMSEMRLAAYDRDGDGRCDRSECRGLEFIVREAKPERVRIAHIIR